MLQYTSHFCLTRPRHNQELHFFPTRRSSDLINGGVYTVPMQINRSINLEFLVDPGAAIVVIPVAIFRSLVSNGTLTQSDILGIRDRKSSLLNSSHVSISYAVFCLKKKK